MQYSDINDNMVLSQVLTRDKAYFLDALEETKDNRIIVKRRFDVVFPELYITKSLCDIDESIYMLGIFALVDLEAKKYAVFSIPARVSIPVTEMSSFIYREDKYRVMDFHPGDTFIETTDIVEDDKLDYWIYDYFIALAKIPWYLNYQDILKIADGDIYYMGKWLGDASALIEMIYGNIARDPSNPTLMYRHALKTQDDVNRIVPEWVPLKNVSLGPVDTLSKIMGSYYDDGLTSALAEPSKVLTEVEKALRA